MAEKLTAYKETAESLVQQFDSSVVTGLSQVEAEKRLE